MDGGRILKTREDDATPSTSAQTNLGDVVRAMMKEQHKAMFIALRDGQFDPIVDDAIAARTANRTRHRRAESGARASLPPPPPRRRRRRRRGPDRSQQAPPLTLDLDTLADQGAHSSRRRIPPPPANVLSARGGDPGTGRYRTVEEREEKAPTSRRGKSERPPSTRKSQPAPKSTPKSERPRAVREERVKRSDPRAEPPSEPKQPAASKQSARPGANQPAAVRPAAIFGQARPQQSSSSARTSSATSRSTKSSSATSPKTSKRARNGACSVSLHLAPSSDEFTYGRVALRVHRPHS